VQASRLTGCAAIASLVLGGCGDAGADAANDAESASAGNDAAAQTSGGTGQTSGGTTIGTTSGTLNSTAGPGSPASSASASSSSGLQTTSVTTTRAGMSSSGSNTVGTTGTGGAAAVGSDSSAGGTSSEASAATTTDGVGGADSPGSCTESQPVNSNASGSGPHDVTVETNSDAGINEGTIFRPTDLGGDERYPIFVWGEGGCSKDGLSNAAAMAEIASHGYFVVADGTPNGSGSRSQNGNDVAGMAAPLIGYIDWAIAENTKPCSAYYHALDTTKISANGFSCGGLMAEGTAGDPRITTWGITSSGLFSAIQSFYDTVHTPVLIVEGGPSDIAYENGLRDYDNISKLGLPILWFSKDIGHGGDLFQGGGGDFTKIILAWLNWWLKEDETGTGKGALVGAGCEYCSDSAWEVKSASIP